jgi:ornithine cyclodeaminase/alanine dehydrogenase-like protein (mu-crystallin family)
LVRSPQEERGTVETLLFSRADVERLLDMPSCIDAVADAFRRRAAGEPTPSGVLGIHVADGGFHAKAAAMRLGRAYFAAKVNANFPANPSRHALPTIQGVLILFDAERGEPLAIMDSMSVTTLRTAAATAVAARALALPGASTLAVIGCGVQARAHVAALIAVRPLRRVVAFDADAAVAQRFAADMHALHDVRAEAVTALDSATRVSDMIVTCTPSHHAFLGADAIMPGTFIGAVGADSEHKHEIMPDLMRLATVIVDDLGQCATIGDLHHAIEAGQMQRADVRAELGDVLLDAARGRRRDDEIVVFDSTGVAIEDVAAAAMVFERAEREGGATRYRFNQ